jgi:hypothetical protein
MFYIIPIIILCDCISFKIFVQKMDLTVYMVPRSFMYVTERFVSHGPTPAVWPKEGRSEQLAGLV